MSVAKKSRTSEPRFNLCDRASLEAAIAALPTADDDTWSVLPTTLAGAGLQHDEPAARAHVLAFSKWAREAIGRLPLAPPAEFEATDFNDYYKIVMSRVQYLYSQASSGLPCGTAPTSPVVQFMTQLRRRPQFHLGGELRTLGCFDVRSAWPVAKLPLVGDLDTSLATFREALRRVGARKFSRATLELLVRSRGVPSATMEEALQPVCDEWIGALDGLCLFTLLDEDADFSGGEAVEAKTVVQDGVVVVLVQGPWFRCTFCETPLLQVMAQFMTEAMTSTGDADAAGWCREACFNFACCAHHVHATTPRGWASFFSGRRSPHPDFHLLQHLYFGEALGGITSSSLFAGRVFGSVGLVAHGPGSPPSRLGLTGTLAHEGPMACFALHPELDARMPVSSIFWHLLFWGLTSNHTVLPDAFGTGTFQSMLVDLQLLERVHMVRQDSGLLERFAQIFPTTPKFASEIEKYAEVAKAVALGFNHGGAGGFFGEKRRACTEFSLAAKLVKTIRTLRPAADGAMAGGRSVVVGYAGKLGDADGSWADYDVAKEGMPAKFIASVEAPRQQLWDRMLGYGRKGDALHDRMLASGDAGPKPPLLLRCDALALASALSQVLASPSMSDPRYAAMKERLAGFVLAVETAGAALPE